MLNIGPQTNFGCYSKRYVYVIMGSELIESLCEYHLVIPRVAILCSVYPAEAFVCEDVLVFGPKILDQADKNTNYNYMMNTGSSALT